MIDKVPLLLHSENWVYPDQVGSPLKDIVLKNIYSDRRTFQLKVGPCPHSHTQP